jgi:hypothetical protein
MLTDQTTGIYHDDCLEMFLVDQQRRQHISAIGSREDPQVTALGHRRYGALVGRRGQCVRAQAGHGRHTARGWPDRCRGRWATISLPPLFAALDRLGRMGVAATMQRTM